MKYHRQRQFLNARKSTLLTIKVKSQWISSVKVVNCVSLSSYDETDLNTAGARVQLAELFTLTLLRSRDLRRSHPCTFSTMAGLRRIQTGINKGE